MSMFDEEMLAITQNKSREGAIRELVALANQRGGSDNSTVVLVEVKASMAQSGLPKGSVQSMIDEGGWTLPLISIALGLVFCFILSDAAASLAASRHFFRQRLRFGPLSLHATQRFSLALFRARAYEELVAPSVSLRSDGPRTYSSLSATRRHALCAAPRSRSPSAQSSLAFNLISRLRSFSGFTRRSARARVCYR